MGTAHHDRQLRPDTNGHNNKHTDEYAGGNIDINGNGNSNSNSDGNAGLRRYFQLYRACGCDHG